MEAQKGKIMRFSKVVCTLLNVGFVLLIVAGALQALAWLWSVLQLHTEPLTIGGVTMEAPLLFKRGDFRVLLPVAWEPGIDFLGTGAMSEVGFDDFLGTIFTMVGLVFARNVFRLLRDNGSPFREDVVKALHRLSIALLCVGVVSGVIPFLAAGVVWVLCLIFDYGRMLQNESDTTL